LTVIQKYGDQIAIFA